MKGWDTKKGGSKKKGGGVIPLSELCVSCDWTSANNRGVQKLRVNSFEGISRNEKVNQQKNH